MAIVAKVQKLGRIAIPKAYRQLYNLHEGDIVELVITKVKRADGTVVNFLDVALEELARREVSE